MATPAAVPAANVVNNLQRQAGANGGFEQKGLFPAVSNGLGRGPPVYEEKARHGENPGRAQGTKDLFSIAVVAVARKNNPRDWPPNYSEIFWRLYPRRVAKKPAMKALARVRKSGDVTFTALLEAVAVYAESVFGTDIQFIAHPSTWLNQGRWDDDPRHLGNSYHGKISNAQSWADRRRAQIESQERADRPRLITAHTRSGV